MPFTTLRILIFALIFTVAIAGIQWLSGLRADLATSIENNKTLQAQVSNLQDQNKLQTTDIASIKKSNGIIQNAVRSQNEDLTNLQSRLSHDSNGNLSDIGERAAANPAQIEESINKNARNTLRCIELASGSKHTESELNAKLSTEINVECPSLANPHYTPID